jgi:hypothetical protein
MYCQGKSQEALDRYKAALAMARELLPPGSEPIQYALGGVVLCSRKLGVPLEDMRRFRVDLKGFGEGWQVEFAIYLNREGDDFTYAKNFSQKPALSTASSSGSAETKAEVPPSVPRAPAEPAEGGGGADYL